jgi:hypothetical protein
MVLVLLEGEEHLFNAKMMCDPEKKLGILISVTAAPTGTRWWQHPRLSGSPVRVAVPVAG